MDEQNNGLEKLILVAKSGLILLWYYAVLYFVNGMLFSRLGSEDAYMKYYQQNQYRLMIIIYLMIFFGIWAFDAHKRDFIGSFRYLSFKKILGYIGIGIGAYLISNIITVLLLPFFPDYKEIGNMFDQGQPVAGFIATVLLAPIIEEYLFRHKIQGYLKKAFHADVAIVVQAALFGMLHSFVIQKIYAMLIGAFFGWLDERKGTVQCSIIMHMTINCIGWIIGCFLL